MNKAEQDELWHALGVLSRYSKEGEVADRLPGLESVVEVIVEQVGGELNEIKQARAQAARDMTFAARYGVGGVVGPTGTAGPTAPSTGWGFVSSSPPPPSLAVGARMMGKEEYRARLAAARKKRGIIK